MESIRRFNYGLYWIAAYVSIPAIPAYAYISSLGSTGLLFYLEVAAALAVSFVLGRFLSIMFYEAHLAGEKTSLSNRALAFVATTSASLAMSFIGFWFLWPALDLKSLILICIFFFAVIHFLQACTEALAVRYGFRNARA